MRSLLRSGLDLRHPLRRSTLPIASATLLIALTLQRVSELVIAKRNTKTLLARGAYELGASQYPILIAFHLVWLASLLLLGWGQQVNVAFVVIALVLQLGRLWVQRTLGERWTTRIIILPRVKPVRSGPYRFFRHPNAAIVALELPCLSLALGLPWHAIVFGVVNIGVTIWRARIEDAGLAAVRAA